MKKCIATLTGLGLLAVLVYSCTSIPDGVTAVSSFDQQKYLGKWYEIARMDFKHERNLDNVTAEYSLRDDGLIKVDNKGYDYVKKEWKQSIGKAKPINSDKKEGRLKVSFFGPFYSGYNVVAIDPGYQYALVFGDNLKYMWILSRKPSIPDDIKREYLEKAKSVGYKIEELVWPKHDKSQQ